MPLEIIHSLIGKLIFSKYLIDREIFENKYDFNNLIIKKECLFDFFNFLEEKFNPDLFKLSEKQKNTITYKHLTTLNKLFMGYDMAHPNQSVIDCPYDFKIIPIELISNIYEAFLHDKTSKKNQKAIYTPLFLVDYILNNTLDEKLNNNVNCKVLDQSCGSGVFLVETLRRIIDKNLEKKSPLTPDELKKILTKNIFGIDIDKDDTKDYIKSHPRNILLDEDAFEMFYTYTEGLPYYINRFLKILPQNILLKKSDIEREFKDSIDYFAADFIFQWAKLTFQEQKIIISLLKKPKKRIEIADSLNVTSRSLNRPVNHLRNYNLIEFKNDKYQISQPVLVWWLEDYYEKNGVYPFRSLR